MDRSTPPLTDARPDPHTPISAPAPISPPGPDAAPQDGVSDLDLLQTWRALRRVANTVDGRLNAAMAALPVQAQAVETLALLVGSPNRRMTMSRLATLLGVTTGGVTKVVDRLVTDDLVHRQHSATDRRVVFAVLTDRGDDLFAQAMPVYAAQLRAEFAHLSPDRLAELRGEFRGFLAARPASPPRAPSPVDDVVTASPWPVGVDGGRFHV